MTTIQSGTVERDYSGHNEALGLIQSYDRQLAAEKARILAEKALIRTQCVVWLTDEEFERIHPNIVRPVD